jgi:hypothetical protein
MRANIESRENSLALRAGSLLYTAVNMPPLPPQPRAYLKPGVQPLLAEDVINKSPYWRSVPVVTRWSVDVVVDVTVAVVRWLPEDW